MNKTGPTALVIGAVALLALCQPAPAQSAPPETVTSIEFDEMLLFQPPPTAHDHELGPTSW